MFYTPDVNTYSVADTYVTGADADSMMPVAIICASTKDTFKVEISDDEGSTWETIADLESASGDTVVDWMFKVTKKTTQVKTTGTGFLRVQGSLVAA